MVYEKMTGDYAQSRTISDRVYQKLIDSHGITTAKGFGIYYDNPKTEKKKICVPMLGVILEYDFDKLETWKDDFEVTEYPISEYLVVEFSYKGMSSVILGIMKVYLAFETYVEENSFESDIPVMEIWDSAQ